MKTHYDVLGVPPNADFETVKAAYRKIVKAFHPDLHRGDVRAELRSKQIITAYAILKDPEGRARYDQQLRHRRSRLRLLVITALVSAGLVSGSTLFFLNFLLKPNAAAPVARISAAEKVALAEDVAPAVPGNTAPLPREGDAVPAESAVALPATIAVVEPLAPEQVVPPQAPAASPPEYETAWLAIEKNGDAEQFWLFIQRYPGTPQAELAEKRLEPLIDAIQDIETLKALAAKATGGFAERVLARIKKLAAVQDKEIITAALPEHTRAASQAEANAVASDTHPPRSERPDTPHDDSGARLASSDPKSAVHQALSLMSTGQYGATPFKPHSNAPIAPGNAKYYVYRAGFWAGKGDLERALTDYDAAILLDGASISAFHGRGMLRWRRGENELALADLDQAIRLSFADPKIYLDRGRLWYERGRYDRAIADFNQAIKLAPYLASAYSYRGMALRRKRDFKSAIADLDQAIKLNPAIEDAYRNRDLARTERDDPLEAAPEALR